ncbi:hypothetical protein QJQ45_027829 [Haematococcus lacustris]|nr:hypothetical protein QJQ45_027829 [Haematococcus lacustris]
MAQRLLVKSSAATTGYCSQVVKVNEGMSLSVDIDSALSCCASLAFAERLAASGPHPNFAALVAAARSIWWNEVGIPEWLAAFAAHPKIGDNRAASAKPAAFGVWSRTEQAAAASSSTEDVAAELATWNQKYLDKFGFIFIIFAKGRLAPEILAALKARYQRQPYEELRTAAQEQMKITELRLGNLFGKSAEQELLATMQRRADKQILSQMVPQASSGPLRSPITTHVLDAALGVPAKGLAVALMKREDSSQQWETVAEGITNDDGRVGALMAPSNYMPPGRYRMLFHTGSYLMACKAAHPSFYSNVPFYPEVSVDFEIDPEKTTDHYHEEMAEVAMERHGRAKQLVVFFGAATIGTRWVDRDCNAALNMQRIGEARWRLLELCWWPEQGKLPAKGKVYPGLEYKWLRDKPPMAQQQQQKPAAAQYHCDVPEKETQAPRLPHTGCSRCQWQWQQDDEERGQVDKEVVAQRRQVIKVVVHCYKGLETLPTIGTEYQQGYKRYEIQVPRMALFDLWLAPRAQATVSLEELQNNGSPSSRITIQGQDCVLHGSSHVEQFSLNDRFNLDVNISFQSEQAANSQTARLTTDGRIGIQIDIPPPFSMMPKPVLEGAGNTALQSTLGLLLGAVVKSMTSDYPKWAQTASQGQGQHPKQIV